MNSSGAFNFRSLVLEATKCCRTLMAPGGGGRINDLWISLLVRNI